MMLILGIDEAGRGAVLGPMVICGAVAEEKNLPKLKAIGVKDSKLLTPAQREKLYPQIKKILKDWVVLKVSAQEIDELRKKINLNRIEAEHMAQIIAAVKADKAYIDAPQVSTEKFKAVLQDLSKTKTELIVENFADVKYPICSAASIIAKVDRDAEIQKIKEKVGVDFGVGYSHDARTIAFVRDCLKKGKYLEYIRHSWETVAGLKAKLKQKSLKEF